MRIVLDTNIVLSALLWRGAPHQLLNDLRTHSAVRLFSSPWLLEELSDVLTRPMAAKQLAIIDENPHDILADYLELIDLVEPLELPRVARDPDDDHVLACALAARATLIVSGDRDLLTLGTFRDIPILSASQALALIAQNP